MSGGTTSKFIVFLCVYLPAHISIPNMIIDVISGRILLLLSIYTYEGYISNSTCWHNITRTGFDRLIQGEATLPTMRDVARLRDSTQILLPKNALSGLRAELEDQFMVTVRQEDGRVRIIGSPVEIKSVSDFLTRNGVTVA